MVAFFLTRFKVALLIGFLGGLASVQASVLKPEAMLARAKAAVSAELPPQSTVYIEHFSCRRPVPATAKLRIVSPHPALGLTHFRFSWWENESEREVYATGVVRAELPVAVARSGIRLGEALSPENIAFERRELSLFVQTGYFPDLKSLEGLRANGVLHPGQVIGTMNVQRQLAVTQGQTVELSAERGNLRIVARMRAVESGAIANWIRVENPTTHKVLIARVVAPGEVKIQ